ncbi:hypothetical protein AB1N83_009675 [Pleurotus pulmonarius]
MFHDLLPPFARARILAFLDSSIDHIRLDGWRSHRSDTPGSPFLSKLGPTLLATQFPSARTRVKGSGFTSTSADRLTSFRSDRHLTVRPGAVWPMSNSARCAANARNPPDFARDFTIDCPRLGVSSLFFFSEVVDRRTCVNHEIIQDIITTSLNIASSPLCHVHTIFTFSRKRGVDADTVGCLEVASVPALILRSTAQGVDDCFERWLQNLRSVTNVLRSYETQTMRKKKDLGISFLSSPRKPPLSTIRHLISRVKSPASAKLCEVSGNRRKIYGSVNYWADFSFPFVFLQKQRPRSEPSLTYFIAPFPNTQHAAVTSACQSLELPQVGYIAIVCNTLIAAGAPPPLHINVEASLTLNISR